MAPSKKTKEQARNLRQKLIKNEMNPILDIFLSLLILLLSPIIAVSAMMHDRLMYKFLNRTYIYNVSWEVRSFHPSQSDPHQILTFIYK
jgi:hypothetical protein